MINPATRDTGNPWSSHEDDKLWLLTPQELKSIPDGTVLHGISGGTATVGVDTIDTDTRFGVTAWGLRESQLDEEGGEE